METSLVTNAQKAAISCEALASRYEVLIRLAEVIRSKPEEEDLFETLVSELHQVIPFDGISQLDPGANRVRWQFLEPYKEKLEAMRAVSAFPRDETPAWWVYRNQQPIMIRVGDGGTHFPRSVSRLAKIGLRSLYVLPLSTAHRQLGSLTFASHLDDAYSTEDQRFLSLVADKIALAMDDARAHQRLRLLLDITNRMVTKLELRDLLREIVASIRQCMQCDKVGVALPDPEDGELRRYVSDHAGCEEMSVGSVPERSRIVFRTGKPLIATTEELAVEFEGAIGLNSLCVYPLIMRERVLGVFGLESSRENAFTKDDFTFLGQVADQIAIAVENALAYGQISELKDKLAQENVYLESEIRSELHFDDIVGNSELLRRVLREVETVAPADSTVLIYGETGTGKELIARAVHNLSSRKSNPFVKLNCAATRKVHSPALSFSAWAVLNWRIAEQYSWMRSATFRWNCSQNSCVCYRSGSSNAWAARTPFAPMCG
jgi:formate hydrogenlyase transcriptional activator